MSTLHIAKGSQLFTTIATVLTKIPGIKSLKVSPGDNETVENADLDDAYRAPVYSGVKSEGSFSGQAIWDPTNATQQFIQARYNDGATNVGKIVHGASAVETTCNYIITKWEPTHDVGEGLMVDFEGKFTTAFALNES
jgi:hypothetical protein